MTYKGYEILARVHETGSDLYSLNEDGSLNESQGIQITHDDQTIVWYEVEGMENTRVHSSTGFLVDFIQLKSLEEAKENIDIYLGQEKTKVEEGTLEFDLRQDAFFEYEQLIKGGWEGYKKGFEYWYEDVYMTDDEWLEERSEVINAFNKNAA